MKKALAWVLTLALAIARWAAPPLLENRRATAAPVETPAASEKP